MPSPPEDDHALEAVVSTPAIPRLVRRLIPVAVAIVLVVIPLAWTARPVADADVTAAGLAARIREAATLPWSGLVESSGALRLPGDENLAGVGEVLGGDNDLRVWWAGPTRWRIDRLRSTGEVDLFRQDRYTIRWEFETQTATSAPVSRIRLPDVSDLVPGSLASFVLSGISDSELSRIPASRIAGIDAVGLRIVPADPASSVERVDLWADPVSGLALRVDVFGTDPRRPSLTTAVSEVRLGPVDDAVLIFAPPSGSTFRFDQSVDVAAEANALAPADLPPTLAGLASRTGDPGAAGAYGSGPTVLIVVPLRGSVAGPLRAQLRSAGAQRTSLGWSAPSGPLTLFVTSGRLDPTGQGMGFLLAGTVTAATLDAAARQLVARR